MPAQNTNQDQSQSADQSSAQVQGDQTISIDSDSSDDSESGSDQGKQSIAAPIRSDAAPSDDQDADSSSNLSVQDEPQSIDSQLESEPEQPESFKSEQPDQQAQVQTPVSEQAGESAAEPEPDQSVQADLSSPPQGQQAQQPLQLDTDGNIKSPSSDSGPHKTSDSLLNQPRSVQAGSDMDEISPAAAGTSADDQDTDTQDEDTAPPQNIDPAELAGLPDLLQILVTDQALALEQAKEVNNKHLSTDQSIAEILKQQQLVSEPQLVKAMAKHNDIPYVRVSDTGISPEALALVDEGVAKRHQVLPFAIDKNQKKLKVAMANPLDVSTTNFIEQKTGYDLEVHYAAPSELKSVIAQRYAQDLSSDVTQAVEESTIVERQKGIDAGKAKKGGMIRAAPINKIVNTILDYAMESRASDVHIEPQPHRTRVRYRIDGILQEKLVLPSSVHSAVVSRIKILADLKIDEKRVPQDGRFDYAGKSEEVDLRVSTCPTIHGEKVVMRLLKKNASVPGLRGLGMRGLSLKTVRRAIQIPNGIILITGPTGSGKTTTLYSILNIINTPKVNIMTLEDPVEYQMNGVTQVQVNPQAGLNFANGLRSFLRQDPDIIMVGEIRDTETAELAVQASLTGHLVFSTLHTNSAAGALPRLMDMGVEPFLLSSSIILAMAQRVVRRINPDYKEDYKPDQAVIEDIKKVLGGHFTTWCQQNNKDPNEITLSRARKDRPDSEPEYKGRIGIFEVMDITDKIQHMINKSANADELEEEAINNGMMLMKQDGYIKALEGITTIEEVLRVAEVK